ncbi:MAG: hypothetical protein NT169_23830 [Chloroflexi bacterium]|nr:hypothetical protein [Chloroflexota bacterium]
MTTPYRRLAALVAGQDGATMRRLYPMMAAGLLALHLLLAAGYSLAVPPWEAHDEWAHYKFVEYVARHRALPPSDQRLTNEYEFDEAGQPPLYYVIAALPVLLVDTSDGFVPQVNPYFNVETGAGGINAAIHRPEQEHFPGRGTLLALRLARLMSLLISLIGLAAIYKLGRLLAPERPVVALTGLAVAALSPQYLFISAVVTNDVLIAALGCVVAWLGVKIALEGLRPGPVLALVVTTGLALLTKVSALALLPFVAAAFIAAAIRSLRRGVSRRLVWAMLGIILAAGLLLLALWFWRNLRLTGALFPRDPWAVWRLYWRWIARTDDVVPFQWRALPAGLRYGFRTFWASFGWGNLEAYRWVYWLFAGLCGGGLAGLVIWLADRRVRRALKAATGLAVLLALSLLLMAAYRDFDQGSTLIRGRYLLPALAPVAVLIALGWDALLRGVSGRARWPAWAFPATVAAILTCANVLLPWQVIAPAYAPPPASATGTQPGDPAALRPGEQPLGAQFLAAADDPTPAAELIAYELWPETVRPGEALGVTLVWRVLRPLAANYTVGVHLLDAGLNKVGEVNVYPGRGAYATTLWRPGDVFSDSYWVPVQREIAQPVLGRVKVALFVDTTAQADPAVIAQHLPVTDAQGVPLGEAALFGRFKLAPAQPAAEPVAGPGLATVGDTIRLAAATWQADQTPVLAGNVFTVTLTWDALARPPADYQVFVHLDDEDGPLAFGDGPPVGGAYPTGLWERGDRVVDTHVVHVPNRTPRGTYRLVVGMYDAADQRPAVVGPGGERLAFDQILLDHVPVVRLERRGFFPLYLREYRE